MILIEAKESSPYIEVNNNGTALTIKGNSFMPNPSQFYHILNTWVATYKTPEGKDLKIEVTMGYYNTSSIQIMNLLLKTLNTNSKGKIKLTFLIDKEEDDLEDTALSLAFNTGIEPTIKFY